MRALLSRGVLRLRALGGHFIAAGPLVHSPGRPAATARLLLGSARRRPEPRSAREGAGGEAPGRRQEPQEATRGPAGPGWRGARPEPSRAGQRVVPSALAAADARCGRGCDSASRPAPTRPAPASASCRRDQSHERSVPTSRAEAGADAGPLPELGITSPRSPQWPSRWGGLGFGCWSGCGWGPGLPSFGSKDESAPPAPPAHPPPSLHPGCSGPWLGRLSQRAIVSRLGCCGWGVVARGPVCGTKALSWRRRRVRPPAWLRTIPSGYKADLCGLEMRVPGSLPWGDPTCGHCFFL